MQIYREIPRRNFRMETLHDSENGYVPPKRRTFCFPHGITILKTTFFLLASLRSSNQTLDKVSNQEFMSVFLFFHDAVITVEVI
jgi:hypothetical protein